MCDGCPGQCDCRAHAFGVGKRYGVWGGTNG
ncbi:WhiB family transcriptional regulator [Rhodococcus opacus]|nr:WhiB family transcriptional regulator [Rhodococcus opacus]MDV7087992.1 WhiB family transcriptional regulator [Rhodococcus opacus]